MVDIKMFEKILKSVGNCKEIWHKAEESIIAKRSLKNF